MLSICIPSLSTFPKMSRWTEIFRSSESEPHNDNLTGCYECTRVGGPIFHSTRCEADHQPEWEALAGSSLVPIQNRSDYNPQTSRRSVGRFGSVLDPRSESVRVWNRVVFMARGIALAVDPLFFFALAISLGCERPCVYMDGRMAAIVAVVRTCVDAVQLCHLCIQFRLAYVSTESLGVGCGKLVWDAGAIAYNYLRSLKAFWFDAFVIVPLPQVVYLLVVPKLLREERVQLMLTILQPIFLLQFLPKVYHSFSLMQRMRKVTGYIFGSIWWAFGLSLIAYFLASHVAGGYWYILSIRRVASCLSQQCNNTSKNKKCFLSLCCSGYHCGTNSTKKIDKTPLCLDGNGPFRYGIFQFALPLISSDSIATKILYSNLWGLMALSTMGNNLEPTTKCSDVMFSICMVLGGLTLFSLLILNIQIFLHAVMARRRKMQLRYRDLQWWMRGRQLPSRLRKRVRHFERQRWATTGGVENEMELIKDLPEGLRRDIKRHLCLDLIKKVPLFDCLDDLILDNICDRVNPLVLSKGEKIIRGGEPVQRMVFIVRGRVKRSQILNKGTVATSILQPGSFLGDELLSWCFRRPFIDRLPPSSATFTCTRPTEAFSLNADDLRYITDHFRYKLANDKVKQTARYYSSNWRTWAAVNIQFAWRRYVVRNRGQVSYRTENEGGDSVIRLRHYAAVFMSLKPHDHLE